MGDNKVLIELSKKKLFEFDNNNKLGVMRIDWYDGSLANTWSPTKLIIELNNKKVVDLQQLQQELNIIQFEKLKNFDEVIKYCGGGGFENETLLYVVGKNQNYIVKLIPLKDSYSYIYVYNKSN